MHESTRASKATPYEESIHVPFVIRWGRGVPAGTRSDAFMGAIDIMPSLLGMCGVPLPDGLQGRDVSSVWRGGVRLDSEEGLVLGRGDSSNARNWHEKHRIPYTCRTWHTDGRTGMVG